MNKNDIDGFFADESELIGDDYLIFTYLFETTDDPNLAAASLASEQSTAQWKRPGVDEDFRPRYGAKVVDLNVIGESDISQFDFAAIQGGRFTSVLVRIAHPHANFGARLPNLLTAAMGEGAFFSPGITSIKLLDIEFPDEYLKGFSGPHFGTSGIRKILGVDDRPLFFGVVKPNVGLDPKSFAELAFEAWMGGLDAAKDDEMLSDPLYSPFAERMRLVGEAKRRAEDESGEKKIFIANITDEVDHIHELHDIAVRNGVNAVMLNVMAVGLSGVRSLSKYSKVPIIAHFDCIAPMSRHPNFGVSTKVFTKLQRISGCDSIIMPGFGDRMSTPDDEVIENVVECSKLLGHMKSVLPVPGGSDWAGTLVTMYKKLRTLDFAMVPGRGVFGHPMGPRGGATSLRQAWEAIVRRIPLEEFAADCPELSAAIEAFGGNKVESVEYRPEAEIRGYTGATLPFIKN